MAEVQAFVPEDRSVQKMESLLKKQQWSGHVLLIFMGIVTIASVFGAGFSITKNGTLSIRVPEARKMGDIKVVETEHCDVDLTIGEQCTMRICSKTVWLDCSGVEVNMSVDEMKDFAKVACFSKTNDIICTLFNGSSMMYFTVAECGEFCNLLSALV